ncbi:MAG: hypothetical protein B6245_06055 [Desulfobacteraceae bacterium 4572_88]|nr:MAG: hypothetical protein B6245_06055 [Desulfobacteraceae bacterium 4572_88]
MKIHTSLKSILSFNFIVAATLPILIVGSLSLHILTQSMEAEISQRNLILAQVLASEVERFLEEPMRLLRQIRDIADGQFIRQEQISGSLQTVLGNYKFFDTIMMLDQQGIVTHLAPYDEDMIGNNMSYQPFFKDTRDSGQACLSPTFISMQTGQPTLTLSISLRQGIIAGYLNLGVLGTLIKKVRIGDHGYAGITDRDGVLIAHPDTSLVSQRMNIRNVYVIRQAISGREGTFPYSFRGVEKLGSAVILPHSRWIVVVAQPIEEAFAPVRKIRNIIWAGTLMALGLAITIAMLSLRKTLNPLLRLAKDTQRVAGGDYHFPAYQKNYREVDELADNFKTMIEAVKTREEALRESWEKLADRNRDLKNARNYVKNIIDSMPSFLVSVDTEGRIIRWNMHAENFSDKSWKEAKGRLVTDIFPHLAIQMADLKASLQKRLPVKQEKQPARISGETRYHNVVIYPLTGNGVTGAVVRLDDVTERVRIEEMMVQTEKMISVGGLAAGTAHEINNPLAVILQGSQNTLRRLSPEFDANVRAARECQTDISSIRAYLEKRGIFRYLKGIEDAGTRAAEIVSQMISFTRPGDSRMHLEDINDLLDQSLTLAASDYDLKKKYGFECIEIVRDYDSGLDRVLCSASDIKQVLLNLLRNAAQAMPWDGETDGPSRRITLKTGKEGHQIRIEVQDNGPGMPENIRKRIFEPFYTTKGVGVGTGLGLSVSFFIVTNNHKGTISAESEPGKGTRFIVRLPIENAEGEKFDADFFPSEDEC